MFETLEGRGPARAMTFSLPSSLFLTAAVRPPEPRQDESSNFTFIDVSDVSREPTGIAHTAAVGDRFVESGLSRVQSSTGLLAGSESTASLVLRSNPASYVALAALAAGPNATSPAVHVHAPSELAPFSRARSNSEPVASTVSAQQVSPREASLLHSPSLEALTLGLPVNGALRYDRCGICLAFGHVAPATCCHFPRHTACEAFFQGSHCDKITWESDATATGPEKAVAGFVVLPCSTCRQPWMRARYDDPLLKGIIAYAVRLLAQSLHLLRAFGGLYARPTPFSHTHVSFVPQARNNFNPLPESVETSMNAHESFCNGDDISPSLLSQGSRMSQHLRPPRHDSMALAESAIVREPLLQTTLRIIIPYTFVCILTLVLVSITITTVSGAPLEVVALVSLAASTAVTILFYCIRRYFVRMPPAR